MTMKAQVKNEAGEVYTEYDQIDTLVKVVDTSY